LNPVRVFGIHKVTLTVTLCIPVVTMQPSKLLEKSLAELANEDRYLFSLRDLKCVVPGQSLPAFKTMLSRCVKSGILERVCQGIYIYPFVKYPSGLVLYHTAARLRADAFNYLSLESILSDAGIISQLPMNWITMMSSGRGHVVQCGGFGTIEFIHTKKKPSQVGKELFYDSDCRLWRASVGLALRDIVATGRSTELINWDVANELI
jgi:hypothetical protein